LIEILKELDVIQQNDNGDKYKLPELREKLATHMAFDITTRLEQSAKKFGIKIIWCPKYHCELNPIEGFWCDLKWFVRKHNDQDYKKLNDLIVDGMKQYEEKGLNQKLWFRFWLAIEMYENKATYQDVLQTLFGAKSLSKVKTHKKIKSVEIPN
jgi:hypothetical protein